MRPKSFLKCLAVMSLGVLSACALRPYYRQVLPPDVLKTRGQQEVLLRLVEPQTGNPIPGGRIVLTTNFGSRITVTSDPNGLLRMPVTAQLLSENPLVEAILPPTVQGYSFVPVKPEPEAAPQPEAAPPPAPPPPPAPAAPAAPPAPATPTQPQG